MSERALGFVEEWIADRIDTGTMRPADDALAQTLARECLKDAAAQGIPEAEIGESIEDLAAFIGGAIREANERGRHEDEDEDEDS